MRCGLSWSLSPGELERVTFARLFLYKPDWVFLDESTSNLDQANEKYLYGLLKTKLPNCTVISIGHQISLRSIPWRDGRLIWKNIRKTLLESKIVCSLDGAQTRMSQKALHPGYILYYVAWMERILRHPGLHPSRLHVRGNLRQLGLFEQYMHATFFQS